MGLLLASACTGEPADPASEITIEFEASCLDEAALTSAEIDALAQRFNDPDLPDPGATDDFVGLCESAAFELAEQLKVRAFVLTRDGTEVGESTLSFTNTIALVIADNTVVEADHQ